MNTSPRFRYYLAVLLLTLLGLAVRVQSVAGPENTAGAPHPAAVAQLSGASATAISAE